MLFEEAFDKAYSQTPAQLRPTGDKNIPKILAFLWSMLAIAEGQLDDCAYIKNQDIVSIPLNKELKEEKSGNKIDADQTTPKIEKPKKDSASKKNKKSGAEIKTSNGATESNTPTA
jgi:hypothetical protein